MITKMKKTGLLIAVVFTLFISLIAVPNEVKAATQVDQIITYAKSLIGSSEYNAYCQRFVKICYQSAGIYATVDAPSAIEAWQKWGLSTSKNDIPIGATVYFTTSSIYGHVGIYTGDGKMIDAQSPAGVSERTISATYWNNYLGWGYQAGIKPEGSSIPIVLSAPVVTAKSGNGSVTLSWNAVSNATSYNIYAYNNSTNNYILLTTQKGTSYTQTDLTNGTTYTYLVRAADGTLQSPFTSADLRSATPSAPILAAPNVTATAGDSKISLNWGSITNAIEYQIFSYNSINNTYAFITSVTGNTYTQLGLKNGVTYTYLVKAYDGISYSSYTALNNVSAKPIAAPVGTALAGNGKVMLYWKAVIGATEYGVYSYDNATNTYTLITSTTGIAYTHTGLINGYTYTYLIKAYNGISWSAYTISNHINVKPIAAPMVTIMAGDGKLMLNWGAVTGATAYRIYSYNSATKQYSGLTTVNATSFIQSGLTNGKLYTYLVLAYNGISWNYTDAVNHISAKPISAPVVTAEAGDGKITLKWGAVTGATCYRIYSYNSMTKKYVGITTVSGTSYTQSGLTNGKSYTYLVLAYNGVSWNYTDIANNITAIPHK